MGTQATLVAAIGASSRLNGAALASAPGGDALGAFGPPPCSSTSPGEGAVNPHQSAEPPIPCRCVWPRSCRSWLRQRETRNGRAADIPTAPGSDQAEFTPSCLTSAHLHCFGHTRSSTGFERFPAEV